jgi:hypothetical protein
MEEIKRRLEQMLSWSDRLGSDETFEIKEIIRLITIQQTIEK